VFEFFKKKAPERTPKDEPESPIVYVSGQPVRFLSSAAIMTAEVAQRKSPQLFRITNFIASSVQSVPWYAEKDSDVVAMDQAQPTKIKALNSLLKSPNDSMTAEQLRYWLATNLMIYGRAHYKVGLSSVGDPNGIYPLAAKYITGVLNNRGVVEAYIYGQGENKETIPTRKTAKPGQAYAAEISFPSLSGLVEYNKSPAAIECLAIPIAIIHALMQRALDTASGHPNVKYIITAEKTLTKLQKDALTKYMEDAGSGEDKSGQVLFLYNTTIEVHPLDNQLGDIHSKIPMDDMTRQVAGVFGVPIALLGLGSADAAKYANNYGESRLSFWQDTIVPSYLKPIGSALTQALCPDGACIKFDLDDIPALWAGRAALGESLSKVAFLTTDEKRAILDFEPDPTLPAIIGGTPPGPDSSIGDKTAERNIVNMRSVS
jgi:phage portal protein BeeE